MATAAGFRVTPKIMGRLRLASQGLLGSGFASIPDAVRWMTATQAQDLAAAMWAIGVRVPGAGLSDVRAALDSGQVVRSWPMRGTLHLVIPEDLQWMLGVTNERLMRGVTTRHRELDITYSDVEKCRDLALDRVSGGGAATRQELFGVFEAAGQGTLNQRGIHLLASLCQYAWLVQGPMAGNQQLMVAFDEWIPVSWKLERREAIAEFMLRYFSSHGPATLRDFSWWTQIPLTEVRDVFEDIRDRLVELVLGDCSYWLSPETAELLDDAVPGQRTVLALPGFDEFLLGYADRSLVLAPEHAAKIVPGNNGVFKKTIVSGGQIIGTWGRQGTGQAAGVVPVPFDDAKPLGPAAAAGFRKAAGRYTRFLAG
ncbi:winged helix DNA-binding domain-containing protein [Pseudarthrobacter sp. N5]|uniref:winged helix DNA-binding domain-containing protein n=1 Tax=Pseudarthrobacter sp. N5 TaxID=3418416 RepID=UPI003CF81E38